MLKLDADRSLYRNRLGDPATWTGDWNEPSGDPGDQFRTGRYLHGEQQSVIAHRLQANERMLIGLAIRHTPSKVIAAVLCVSREAVDRRLRPLGLKKAPGEGPGRPKEERRTVLVEALPANPRI